MSDTFDLEALDRAMDQCRNPLSVIKPSNGKYYAFMTSEQTFELYDKFLSCDILDRSFVYFFEERELTDKIIKSLPNWLKWKERAGR